MREAISHERKDEDLASKARWFQSLTLDERMSVFVSFTNLILQNNPDIVKKKYVRPASDRISIISSASG